MSTNGRNPDGRTLIISRHAVTAYSRRRMDDRCLEDFEAVRWNLDELRRVYGRKAAAKMLVAYRELEQEIRECVTYAFEQGLDLREKPPGFILYRRTSGVLPIGQRFVRCDVDSNYGFIVKRLEEGQDIVVTTLTRAGARR